MLIDIFYSIILNMSVLLFFAQIITKISLVNNIIFYHQNTYKSKIFLIIFFGFLGIFATITGVRIENAICNVRSIAIMSAGILFGPVVGIGAGLIAALHRLFLAGNDFTSVACAISTLLAGFIASYYHYRFTKNKCYWHILIIVALTELLQMGIILLISRPLEQAYQLVSIISLPMIIINAIGVTLFVSVFELAFINMEAYYANKIALSLDISQKCLPYLRKGINDLDSLDKATDIILEYSSSTTVAFISNNSILTYKSNSGVKKEEISYLIFKSEQFNLNKISYIASKKETLILAPLFENSHIIGYLFMAMPINSLLINSKLKFVDGLSKIISTQLELAKIEQSEKIIKKLELETLKAQINPHFLFNILNTIISLSRTDNKKTRDTLIALSIYFRNILDVKEEIITLNEELKNVKSYFSLEKIRFDNRIELKINSQVINTKIPRFAIQSLVENAIKHALNNKDKLIIDININKVDNNVIIDVIDNGSGIDNKIILLFENNALSNKHIGLNNVNQRIKSYYGNEYGLEINKEYHQGSKITVKLPVVEVLS